MSPVAIGTSAFLYRRLASPLHAARAGVGATWALALTAAALILFHPLVLLAMAVAVVVAGVASGVGAALARSVRTAAIVAVPIVAVNVLVSRQGLTVFARLGDLGPFGQGSLTVEAAAYGAVIALKLSLLIFITTLASLTVDPDELLRALRRLSFRSTLTASLATRMIPLLAADSRRVAEAQRTRPGGGPSGARGRVVLLAAILAGSLDRAMDVAATLELRGFAAARPQRQRRRSPALSRPRERVSRYSRHDIAFTCSAAAVLALALAGRIGGSAGFRAYPLLDVRIGAQTLALCVALMAAILLPFCDRRGIEP